MTSLQPLLIRLRQLAKASGLLALVLLALYASLGRQYIGLLEQYQDQLLSQLESASGLQLEVEGLNTDWAGLSPIVQAERLRLGSQASLSLQGLSVKLNVIGSVLGLGPRISVIEARSATVVLQEIGDGQWQLPGFSAAESSGADSAAIDILLDVAMGIRQAGLQSLKVELHYRDGQRQQLRSEGVELRGDGEFRRVLATGQTATGSIGLIAESYGDPRDVEDFHATAYLQIQDAAINELGGLVSSDLRAMDSRIQGRMWLNWRQGRRLSTTGEFGSAEFAAGALWGSRELFNDVKMRFAGSHRDGFWHLSFAEFSASWKQRQLDFAGLSLRHPDAERWQFRMPSMDLQAFNKILLDSEGISRSLRSVTAKLAPQGLLKNLQLDLVSQSLAPLAGGEASVANAFEIELRAELHDTRVNPFQGAPGVEGLAGFIEFKNKQGRLLIDSPKLAMAFPQLYPEPFQLSDFRAELRWLVGEERLQIYSGPIQASDQQAELAALLRLDLPLKKDADTEPTMTLSVGSQGLGLQAAQQYLPETLPASLRNWLQRSLREGRAEQGAFLYRGSLVSANHLGRSIQLHLGLQDLELAFLEDWPSLKASAAKLAIDNADTLAWDLEQASLAGVPIDKLDVAVKPRQGVPTLSVQAQSLFSYAGIKQLFAGSPLGTMSQQFLASTDGEGSAVADISLSYPFVEGAKPDVDVRSQLKIDSFHLPAAKLNLTALRGPLHYSSARGLHSPALDARWLGQAVTATVNNPTDNNIIIDADLPLEMGDIVSWLDQPVLHFLSGSGRARLRLHTAGPERGVRLSSDMRGIEFRLPPPLYKPAEAAQALSIFIPLAADDKVVSVSVADQLRARVSLDGDFPAVGLHLGQRGQAALRDGFLTISGELAFASLAQWQQWVSQYAQGDGDSVESMQLGFDRLQFGEFAVLGQIFSGVSLSGDSDPEFFNFDLAGEQLSGLVKLPRDSARAIVLDLEQLKLPGQLAAQDDGDIEPRNFPRLQVDIDELWLGERHWGTVGFDLHSDDQGAHFQKLRGRVYGIRLDAGPSPSSLHWLNNQAGLNTVLEGGFAVGNINQALGAVGYNKVIESESGQFQLSLSWPGSPEQFELSKTVGDMQFALREGRFLKTSDAASGALRVLSVFNMANILRRLQFDFRDVFKKGVYFDSMSARMQFDHGQIELLEPLEVEGPSSRFIMNGSINMVADEVDLGLVATLPVGSNLPWVAALVGGLPAAAGAYVVSKVFEEQVDRASSAVYQISGSLQDPEVSFRKIFDVDSGK